MAAERLARFSLARRGFRSHYVTTRHGDVHVYSAAGTGSLPAFVSIHGLGSTAAPFGPVLTRLRGHVRALHAPELPGHGFSAHPGEPVTPDVAIAALTDALDRLIDQPAIVCGNSLGGAVALHYALRRPNKVAGLALISPAGAPLATDEWHELKDAFRVETRADAQRLFERVYHRPPWYLALLAHEFPLVFKRPAVCEILETATNEHSPTPDDLASLTMPILFLWGRSERLLPSSALAYFRAHLPAHARIEEPEGFGHSPHLDEPARVAERLAAFAAEVGRSARPRG